MRTDLVDLVHLVRRAWSARAFVTDGSVVALAAAVVAGAARPVAVPVAVPAVMGVAAVLVRRPLLVVLVAPLLSGALARQAADGAAPAPARRIEATATLVTDPDDAFGGARAVVRAEGHRFELWARGSPAGQLRRALAGEVIGVAGRVEPRRESDGWLLTRHVVGRIEADRVEMAGRGDPASRAANALRRLLDRGAEPLDPGARALFTGFVLGDDRFQDEATIDDFRATGLSHLLVVSGENLAFVLVLLRPVLGRVEMRARFVLVVAAVGLFAVLTRFEPSVLRATAMTVIATLGTTIGRPLAPVRVLALAVAALVLVDPLLVGALGFRLSVAASAGIILLARPLEARLPGPRPLAALMSVTLAAQAFVAPLLCTTDDGVPLTTVPANVLAVPAAAPLMVWGLTGGLVAGVAGGAVARLVHGPTALLLWWVRSVSARFAALPVGRLGPGHLAVLVGVAGAVLAARAVGRPVRRGGRAVGLVAVAVLVVAAFSTPGRPAGPSVGLGPGAEAWLADGGTVLVVDGRAQLGAVLAGLRAAGLRSADVVVSRSASRSAAEVVRVLAERLRPRVVVGPAGLAVPGALVPDGELEGEWDGLVLRVRPDGDRLVVEAGPVDGPGVASPGASPLARPGAPPAVAAHTGRPARAVARGPPVRGPPPGRGHGHPQPHPGLVLRPWPLLGLRRLPAQGR
jgi:competence protein ComEC